MLELIAYAVHQPRFFRFVHPDGYDYDMDMLKAKYWKKVPNGTTPTGKTKYKYYYRNAKGGVGSKKDIVHKDHLVAGASFEHGAGDDKKHYTIDHVDHDSGHVTLSHGKGKSKQTKKMHQDDFRNMIHQHHGHDADVAKPEKKATAKKEAKPKATKEKKPKAPRSVKEKPSPKEASPPEDETKGTAVDFEWKSHSEKKDKDKSDGKVTHIDHETHGDAEGRKKYHSSYHDGGGVDESVMDEEHPINGAKGAKDFQNMSKFGKWSSDDHEDAADQHRSKAKDHRALHEHATKTYRSVLLKKPKQEGGSYDHAAAQFHDDMAKFHDEEGSKKKKDDSESKSKRRYRHEAPEHEDHAAVGDYVDIMSGDIDDDDEREHVQRLAHIEAKGERGAREFRDRSDFDHWNSDHHDIASKIHDDEANDASEELAIHDRLQSQKNKTGSKSKSVKGKADKARRAISDKLAFHTSLSDHHKKESRKKSENKNQSGFAFKSLRGLQREIYLLRKALS